MQAVPGHRRDSTSLVALSKSLFVDAFRFCPVVVLEPFTEADFPQLIAWMDSERLLKVCCGAAFTFPLTPEQLRHHLRGANVPGRSETLAYKALDAQTGQLIGHIALDNIAWENRTGRIARVLVGKVPHRGRGYGQAMTQAALAIGFGQLGLQRIGLGVYDFNADALRCYERCGFRHIGTLRHVLRHEEEYWSSVEMSLLASEWRAAQGISAAARGKHPQWQRRRAANAAERNRAY
ncbi:MAG TPA: GNAT family protein [Hymenobacter sp.]|jgi:RimJ/RimL family protein N-acetyltransferase|uniref:GNAT family N-acetyltransferase n=1 Tax=Hymenobacter sp. TaxID=1898978 RepID=UPI002ED7A687